MISTIIIVICFNLTVFSQGITGKWSWENDELRADVYFADDMYYMEAFIKNSIAQVSEGFSYYMIHGDTLIFNKIRPSEGREPIAYHLFKSISDTDMVLIDLKNGQKDRYKRVDRSHYPLVKYRNNEFYFTGVTNVCVSDTVADNYYHCLNFGEISVNSTIAEIEGIIGAPYDIMDQGSSRYRVYLLEILDDGSQPYFAIEMRDDQLRSIQVTGNASREHLSFSSISLGDYHSFVEQKLGKPSETGVVDDETVYWDYKPFSFSFEIRNDFVYSIKLTRQ